MRFERWQKVWHFVSEHISEAIKYDFICDDIRPIEGGDTHSAFKISDGKKRFFVKVQNISDYDNFQSEAAGLELLSKVDCIRTPKAICHGTAEQKCFLVLEHILMKDADDEGWYQLGVALASLHRENTQAHFGWHSNNYIGSTPQPNRWSKNWSEFFAEQRIGYLLKKLADQGIHFVDIDQAVESVRLILKDRSPDASLLHGDLWYGNVGFNKNQPVLFDPCVYYGDRETDIAMTELFSGFPKSFYNGYDDHWQLEEGYQHRKPIYQLYHILNHALMFGGHYTKSAKWTLEHLPN